MPIYEFICLNCRSELELLVRSGEKPVCPNCDKSNLEKQLSIISAPSGALAGQTLVENCGQPRCCGGGCQSL